MRSDRDHVLGSGGPVRTRTDLTGGPAFWVSSRRVSRGSSVQGGWTEWNEWPGAGPAWSNMPLSGLTGPPEWAGLIKTGLGLSSMGPAWLSQPDSVQVARHIFRVLKRAPSDID
jgi:hypothetical protein